MTVVNRTMYPVQTGMSLISRMETQFASLQTQLATGNKANNLAELGSDRYFDLSIRARMSRLDGYSSNITMVNTRLDMFDQVTTQLDKVESDARSLMTPSAYGTDNINFGTVPSQARNTLDEVVQALNTDVNNRYLFGGSVTDRKPVAETSELIDGANGKAGFAQVASERQQADVGADGLGRLTLATVLGPDTVTLSEDGATPFGFKLSTVTASSAAISVTQPGGTAPQSLSLQFTGQPAEGDSVSIGLTLPDGTADGVTLKAVTGTPGAGEFQIGADADATAANFKAALAASLGTEGKTTLVAASNNAAADNFFNGQGQPVMRVGGPDFAHATTLVTADPTTTVMWYSGGDSTDPRATIQARVDDTQTVNYGAQANESGTLNLVRAMAVLSIQNFSTSDPTSEARFDAVANRNLDRLSETHNSEAGSIERLGIELNDAKVSISDVSARHDNYNSQLQGMLSDIETVPDEQVAMQVLALQTRLQASFQATSLISQLSLVNYIK